jgi:16S rRNA (cytidine1402-2'-O)-methyltransferase
MLYLVSTPLGNLSDISIRAIETLKNTDYILCEDTRHSRILLDHYEISTHLRSYHQFSEAAKEDSIIEDLKNGKSISLISDAGTPGISDPGERIVRRCREESIKVIPIPGPCAAITALSASGMDTSQFQFLGFLPRKSGELKRILIDILHYPGTTICYESPNRLDSVLSLLNELAPLRKISIARELTKKFEEFLYGSANEIWKKTKGSTFKGEITLLIQGDKDKELSGWNELSPEDHVKYLMNTFNIPEKDAIKLAAELRGVPKRDIYRKFHD